VKKLAKTEPKHMCLQLLPKGGEASIGHYNRSKSIFYRWQWQIYSYTWEAKEI